MPLLHLRTIIVALHFLYIYIYMYGLLHVWRFKNWIKIEDIASLLQIGKLIRQRNSLIKQEVCSKMQHTYPSTPPAGEVARSFYWGVNLPDTAARDQDRTLVTWSQNEYGSTMPLRWQCLELLDTKIKYFEHCSLLTMI